jgi:hypothetical protein
LENKITGRESQEACRQDELIGGKPASRKVILTLPLPLALTLTQAQYFHNCYTSQYKIKLL